jgi:hypothetical protein
MGINICVYGPDSKDHPDWDSIRYAGDRDFLTLMATLPQIKRGNPMDDLQIRPADFVAWRQAIAAKEWPNPGRFEHLLNLLENNPDYWISISY